MASSTAARLTEIRASADNCLNGMTYNRTKLARDALDLCNAVDRLTKALAEEQAKNKQPRPGDNVFGDIFGDIIGKKK